MRHFLLIVFFIIVSNGRPLAGEVLTSQNGDRHVGRIVTANLAVRTPYALIHFPVDRIHALSAFKDQTGAFAVTSINNDRFSGGLATPRIDFAPENGPTIPFSPSQIQQIQRDRYGRTHAIQTAIFSMKNGDGFSGKIRNDAIAVRTESGRRRPSIDALLRIQFPDQPDGPTQIFLKNGGILQGDLLTRRLTIAPDILHPLTICARHFRTIQFNADKFVRVQGPPHAPALPDSDADGVPDSDDQCPDTLCAIVASADGCPMDSDGDGIVDAEDACPDTPRTAPVDPDGCWRPAPILFDFNQDVIKPQYRLTLDTVARVMRRNPGLEIEIHGHTDSIGAEAYNRGLSLRRATAAAEVLMDKGIASDRIETQGFGFARPAASNETEAGRFLNRRAEIQVDKTEDH